MINTRLISWIQSAGAAIMLFIKTWMMDGHAKWKKKQFQNVVINILQVGLDAEQIITFASGISNTKVEHWPRNYLFYFFPTS